MINLNFTRVTGNPNLDIKNPLRQGYLGHGFQTGSASFLSRFSFLYIFAVAGLFYLIRVLNQPS